MHIHEREVEGVLLHCQQSFLAIFGDRDVMTVFLRHRLLRGTDNRSGVALLERRDLLDLAISSTFIFQVLVGALAAGVAAPVVPFDGLNDKGC